MTTEIIPMLKRMNGGNTRGQTYPQSDRHSVGSEIVNVLLCYSGYQVGEIFHLQKSPSKLILTVTGQKDLTRLNKSVYTKFNPPTPYVKCLTPPD